MPPIDDDTPGDAWAASGSDDPSANLFRSIGRVMARAIAEHEERVHSPDAHAEDPAGRHDRAHKLMMVAVAGTIDRAIAAALAEHERAHRAAHERYVRETAKRIVDAEIAEHEKRCVAFGVTAERGVADEPPGRLLAKLGRAIEKTAREIAEEVVLEHERQRRSHGGPIMNGRPANGVAVLLKPDCGFADRGIMPGAVVWADPEEPPRATDLVLIEVEGRGYHVGPLDQAQARGRVIGPIVWVENSFEPNVAQDGDALEDLFGPGAALPPPADAGGEASSTAA